MGGIIETTKLFEFSPSLILFLAPVFRRGSEVVPLVCDAGSDGNFFELVNIDFLKEMRNNRVIDSIREFPALI